MTKRILVVDDDPVLRAGIVKILSERQYQVKAASNGFEALETLSTYLADLVISDTSMPGMDGFELYRRARATVEAQQTPFLLLTAPEEEVPPLPGPERPSTLTKPFGPETLVAAVEAEFRRMVEFQVAHAVSLSTLSPELLNPFFHEFRTSLTMIKTCIALLTNPSVSYDPAELREFLDIVRRGGDRVDRLVRDFLAILKLESGVAEKEALEASEVDDVAHLVGSVTQALQHDIEEGGVTVQVDVDEGLPALPVAEDHLYLIVEKLVHNAIKFTKEPGKQITIRAQAEPDAVQFEVIDQGVGIPSDEQDRIFDQFYQLTRAGLERQGAGLGLAVAKGLVELYNGRIWVESQVDKGSTFAFILPTRRQVGLSTPEPPPPEPPEEPTPEGETPMTAEEAFRRMGITFEE